MRVSVGMLRPSTKRLAEVWLRPSICNAVIPARTWSNRRQYTVESAVKQANATPLAEVLATAIKAKGPITVAQFMRQCLTSPHGGYYSSSPDPFGRKGDFITSPEISQLFGEMLGIWLVTETMAQKLVSLQNQDQAFKEGERKKIQLVELGPGRGTLMEDLLRTIKSFKDVEEHIEALYLIETSEGLRRVQHQRLCGDNTLLTEGKAHWQSFLKNTKIPVFWYDHVRMLPTCTAPFFLAHEFFDALPIHSFTKTADGWRELLVDCSGHTTAAESLKAGEGIAKPKFSFAISKTPTAHSILLPKISPRYDAIKTTKSAGSGGDAEITVEFSLESLLIMEEISRRIGTAKAGGALIIDYGPADTVPVNTLRGIRSHRRVSPLEDPGEVDLSADVDFLGLVDTALNASEDVEVHGPVEQGHFLQALGMQFRLEKLQVGKNEEKQKELRSGYERLVDRGIMGMGRIYKALAVCPEASNRPPVGFGGQAE